MHGYENERFTSLSLHGDAFRDMEFIDCVFENCVMDGCTLERCTFTECVFRGCTLTENHSKSTKLSSCVFEDCTLTGVNWMEWIPDSRICYPFDKLTNCSMRYCYFQEMNLTRFSFCGNRLADSMFSDCKLQKADFRECPLPNTEFFRCDLRDADFRDAVGYKVSIQTNTLKGARFSAPEALSLLSELGIKLD